LPEPTGIASMQVHHSLKTPHKCIEIIGHWNTQETAWSNLHCNQCRVPFIHSFISITITQCQRTRKCVSHGYMEQTFLTGVTLNWSIYGKC